MHFEQRDYEIRPRCDGELPEFYPAAFASLFRYIHKIENVISILDRVITVSDDGSYLHMTRFSDDHTSIIWKIVYRYENTDSDAQPNSHFIPGFDFHAGRFYDRWLLLTPRRFKGNHDIYKDDFLILRIANLEQNTTIIK